MNTTKAPMASKCNLRAVLAAGVVFLSAGVASAQTDQPSPETAKKTETVVVTGHRPEHDIDTIVSHFVDQHAAHERLV